MRFINVPFGLLSLPSYEVASMKSYLVSQGENAFVDNVYIQFAEYIGGETYRILRTTGLGEMVFATMLSDDIYNNIVNYVSEKMLDYNLNYNVVVSKCKAFIEKYFENIQNNEDIYGFYLYTQQLFTALYFSKIIKAINPSTVVIFMGYNCQDEMGISLKNTFDWIDVVISNNVEENLFAYLKKTDVTIHDNLDFLPTADYSDFFDTVNECSSKFVAEYLGQHTLQLEVSRGCFWNKCCFCTYNCNSSAFREKSLENIQRDFTNLQKRYDTVEMSFSQLAPEKKWRDTLTLVYEQNPELLKTMSYNFKIETLSKPEDFELLSQMGIAVLVGTESFSSKYLKMLNKNQRVIDNIFVLKFAERYGIPLYHNMLYGFPFETEEMFSETESVVKCILHLQPPFDVEKFRLTYGSDIFVNKEKYGITAISPRKEFEDMILTSEMKKTFIPFFYDFESCNRSMASDKWEKLIDEWRKKYYIHSTCGMPKRTSLLYATKNDDVLHIHDLRFNRFPQLYKFSGIAKSIYEFCDTIKTYEDIIDKFSETPPADIENILNDFIMKKVMFNENDSYLSLSI